MCVKDRQYKAGVEWFKRLGIPTTTDKCSPPSTRQKILGFLYDTVLQKVFIPKKKAAAILGEMEAVLAAKTVERKKLQSLIGTLRWASVCFTGGPAFVRRLEEQTAAARYPHRLSLIPI